MKKVGKAVLWMVAIFAALEILGMILTYSSRRIRPRTVLTLRYLDGLPVAEVAQELGRSLHATETLLVRARAALRHRTTSSCIAWRIRRTRTVRQQLASDALRIYGERARRLLDAAFSQSLRSS